MFVSYLSLKLVVLKGQFDTLQEHQCDASYKIIKGHLLQRRNGLVLSPVLLGKIPALLDSFDLCVLEVTYHIEAICFRYSSLTYR